jgi:hypothetical protein
MNAIYIRIRISADEYLKQYQVPGINVHTVAEDGRNVAFPASILKPFVTHSGIQGRFCILFDQNGKFNSIQRV